MRSALLILLIFLMMPWALPAHAQTDMQKPPAVLDNSIAKKPQPGAGSKLYRSAHRANPQFDLMARTALLNMPEKGFDFNRFRMLYAQTRQYDPIGEDALKLLNDLAYTALNSKDPKKAQLALHGYQQVVATHLANLGVVIQALSMARSDKRFGSVAFFEWLRDGLVKSIMQGRKGRSLKDSFAVMTLPEETAVISYLNLKLLKSTPVKEARVFYNMNEVQDPVTGEKWTLFTNTSVPMQFLSDKQAEEKRLNFDMRKQ
jgi:hypothetical protein